MNEQVFLQVPGLTITNVRIASAFGTFPTAHVTMIHPRVDEKRWGWLWAFVFGGFFALGAFANCGNAVMAKAGQGASPAAAAVLSMIIGGGLIFLGTRLPRAIYTARVTVGMTWTQLYRGPNQGEADHILGAIHAAVGQRW